MKVPQAGDPHQIEHLTQVYHQNAHQHIPPHTPAAAQGQHNPYQNQRKYCAAHQIYHMIIQHHSTLLTFSFQC